jgi:hypothetical protein
LAAAGAAAAAQLHQALHHRSGHPGQLQHYHLWQAARQELLLRAMKAFLCSEAQLQYRQQAAAVC